MIVKFSTRASGSIIYQGDVALQLLHMMGRDDKIPSAMYASDVPLALQKLLLEVETEQRQSDLTEQSEVEPEQSEMAVSIKHRALPLIELLSNAERDNVSVMWSEKD